MPAPYPLLELPPGDFKNMFDYQAINMAAAHNAFIQGINAMVLYAPTVAGEKVEPFVIFSLAVVDSIHHHHDLEETFYFGELEKKLGKGALAGSVEQHHTFVPQLVQLKSYLEDVRAGKEKYDGALIVEKIQSFSDIMVEHLNAEIPVLESSRMRAVFTEKELKDIDSAFMKQALAKIDFNTTLPLSVVCGNPATPWFPPFPTPLKWAIRWWFSRKYSASWEFGPLDMSGKPRLPNTES
ncbi:hemerythrin HHE cation-binding domain protein [Favolaschia claudopus]|uniref:Hemerythrin HHE cation-binding domain protein n=1 Tax=Favolaschia claudopus TaxID=2862362 RepID=A0AAW0D624_9AGAR